MSEIDALYMKRALRLARRAEGMTSPNPPVGAVIARGGRIIGEGYHRKAGLPHAEIEALQRASGGLKGATLYVTLEPCCHWGKTPPCVDAVIGRGIRRVVVGARDPNPLVSGKGIKALRGAGIEVAEGVLEEQCRAVIRPYAMHITTGLPYVTLKLSASLDGRIATSSGESKWISSQASRKLAHRMRSTADAVMVGLNTVISDDPELTVRLVKGKDPVRVVVDTYLRTPLTAKVLGGGKGKAMVFTASISNAGKADKMKDLGVDVIRVKRSAEGVDLKTVLRELGKRGITSLLVEGGGALTASFIRQGLVDRLVYFVAPILIGADGTASVGAMHIKRLGDAPLLKGVSIKMIEKDMLVEGYFKEI